MNLWTRWPVSKSALILSGSDAGTLRHLSPTQVKLRSPTSTSGPAILRQINSARSSHTFNPTRMFEDRTILHRPAPTTHVLETHAVRRRNGASSSNSTPRENSIDSNFATNFVRSSELAAPPRRGQGHFNSAVPGHKKHNKKIIRLLLGTNRRRYWLEYPVRRLNVRSMTKHDHFSVPTSEE